MNEEAIGGLKQKSRMINSGWFCFFFIGFFLILVMKIGLEGRKSGDQESRVKVIINIQKQNIMILH